MKRPDILSVLGVIGYCAVVFGVWQWHRPAAWIIGGLLLLIYAVLASAGKKREGQ